MTLKSNEDYRVPIDDDMKRNMNRIAEAIGASLPNKEWGFALFFFEYSGGSCTYISSGDREGVVKMLQEWMAIQVKE